MSKISKCIDCGEIKSILCKNRCSKCYHLMKARESIKRKIENHRCLDCGKPVKTLRCPHCKKIVKYYRRCEDCLIKTGKYDKAKVLGLNKKKIDSTPIRTLLSPIQESGRGRLRRPCKDCGKMYIPTGKFQRFCEKCKLKRMNTRNLKIKRVSK